MQNKYLFRMVQGTNDDHENASLVAAEMSCWENIQGFSDLKINQVVGKLSMNQFASQGKKSW